MSDEQKAAYVMAQVALFNARIAGMVAENQMRTHRGEAPAYVEGDFVKAAEDSGIHHNAVVGIFYS